MKTFALTAPPTVVVPTEDCTDDALLGFETKLVDDDALLATGVVVMIGIVAVVVAEEAAALMLATCDVPETVVVTALLALLCKVVGFELATDAAEVTPGVTVAVVVVSD